MISATSQRPEPGPLQNPPDGTLGLLHGITVSTTPSERTYVLQTPHTTASRSRTSPTHTSPVHSSTTPLEAASAIDLLREACLLAGPPEPVADIPRHMTADELVGSTAASLMSMNASGAAVRTGSGASANEGDGDWRGTKLSWWGDATCVACPSKLNKHARKVDNNGPLNLMTCFGVEVAAEKAWLCSGCRRNFGRHKASGGVKTYIDARDRSRGKGTTRMKYGNPWKGVQVPHVSAAVGPLKNNKRKRAAAVAYETEGFAPVQPSATEQSEAIDRAGRLLKRSRPNTEVLRPTLDLSLDSTTASDSALSAASSVPTSTATSPSSMASLFPFGLGNSALYNPYLMASQQAYAAMMMQPMTLNPLMSSALANGTMAFPQQTAAGTMALPFAMNPSNMTAFMSQLASGTQQQQALVQPMATMVTTATNTESSAALSSVAASQVVDPSASSSSSDAPSTAAAESTPASPSTSATASTHTMATQTDPLHLSPASILPTLTSTIAVPITQPVLSQADALAVPGLAGTMPASTATASLLASVPTVGTQAGMSDLTPAQLSALQMQQQMMLYQQFCAFQQGLAAAGGMSFAMNPLMAAQAQTATLSIPMASGALSAGETLASTVTSPAMPLASLATLITEATGVKSESGNGNDGELPSSASAPAVLCLSDLANAASTAQATATTTSPVLAPTPFFSGSVASLSTPFASTGSAFSAPTAVESAAATQTPVVVKPEVQASITIGSSSVSPSVIVPVPQKSALASSLPFSTTVVRTPLAQKLSPQQTVVASPNRNTAATGSTSGSLQTQTVRKNIVTTPCMVESPLFHTGYPAALHNPYFAASLDPSSGYPFPMTSVHRMFTAPHQQVGVAQQQH